MNLPRSRTFAGRPPEATSPVSKVPDEILNRFFKEASILSDRRAAKTSLTISHVSHNWREITISDPFLWNRISLTPNSNRQGASSLSDLCLKRSQHHDLEIIYQDLFDYETWLGTRVDRSMTPFDPAVLHLHRCRKLQIVLADRFCAYSILRGLKSEAAPKLVSFEMLLQVEITDNDWSYGDRPGEIFISGAPLLTSLILSGVSPLECAAPLANLTKLSLSNEDDFTSLYPDLNVAEFVAVLQAVAPAIKQLKLTGAQVDYESHPDSWTMVELPVLTMLEIGDITAGSNELPEIYPSGLWKFVSMPSLENLSLYYLNKSQVKEIWLVFKGQRGAKVKSLSLWYVGLENEVEELIETFPNLHKLSLDAGVWAGMISSIFPRVADVDKRCMSSGEARTLPLLQCLALRNCRDKADVMLLRDFMHGRQAVGLAIKRVEFFGRGAAYSALCVARKYADEVIIQDAVDFVQISEEDVEIEETSNVSKVGWDANKVGEYCKISSRYQYAVLIIVCRSRRFTCA